MKFKVDSDACQSATTCIAFTLNDQPIYELDDDNKAEVVTTDGDHIKDGWVDAADLAGFDEDKKDEAEKTILDSAKGCPFNAIVVKDDQGKQVWPEE